MSYIPSGWVKITKTFSDFSAAALTNSIDIYTLPVKGIIHAACLHHTASFSGGTIATYTISIGVAGSLAKYVIASDVLQAPSNSLSFPLITLAPIFSISPENVGATTAIKATAISTIANLSAATAGSIDIYLLVSILP